MADITSIFGGNFTPPLEKQVAPPEDQLRQAMMDAGITPPDYIQIDGNIHRFRSGTKGKGGETDKAGWYVCYGDGIPAGRFGCFRAGIELTFRADVGRKYTIAEEMAFSRRMAEAKQAREEEVKKKQDIASDTVNKIWVDCTGASPDHPYLKAKGIKPNGARVTGDGRLVVPLYTEDGELSSLQYIAYANSTSHKSYHLGGKTKECIHIIGTFDESGVIYIAEGFATAATIHEVTDRPCVVAYSASNLPEATRIMRERFGSSQSLVVVADNDESGVGLKYADQASAKYGARVVMPPIKGDANDYVQEGHNLIALLNPSSTDVLNKLKVVFGDQLGQEYEIPDELIEGMITNGSSTVLYGDSNSGKTFFALSLATAIATGKECYGKKTEQGLVVYLATESPTSIRTRMQAIKKHHGLELENLAMVPMPLNFYENEHDANDVIDLIKAIEEQKGNKVKLIIGDTLARMSAGANENSGEDMAPVMARFDRVAHETKAALLIIHHNGKDQARGARGWSGIRAHIDTEIEVAEKDGVRSATITKQRELASKGDTIYFKLHVHEMGLTKFGSQATTCVAIPDEEASTQQPHKKPTKHDENIRLMERAWWNSGAEVRNDAPYISRSALRELLVADGMSERTAKNKTEASRQDGIIAKLLNSETIKPYEHGWIFVDPVTSSTMILRKNSQ